MASLGNLFFSILYKDNPEELEKIKKRALEQLKDIEIKINMSSSKEDISKQIEEVLARERKINVSIDKEKLSTDVKDAVSSTGGEQGAQNITAQTDAYTDLESSIKSIIGTRGQNIKLLAEEKTALANIQSQLRMYDKIQRDGYTLNKKQLSSKASLINKEYEHKQAIAELNQLIKSDVKLSQSSSTSMDELSIRLSRMKTAYSSLSSEMAKSPFGVNLQRQIQSADKEMKSLDSSIGNNQRNVGNYKSAFNGLGFQVQQLARELPSIAYGANIFFAAISNNLPMFADEVKLAKEAYAKLKTEQANGINLNQKAVPVWRQLISSIFSWQTAIVAAVTILTLFGAKIVEGIGKMLKFRDATELSRKEIKKLGEDFAEAAGKELAKLDLLFENLDKAIEGTVEWYDARAQILTQHGDTLNAMNTEIATLGDKAGAYRVLRDEIYATAKAEAMTKGTQDAQDKAIKTATEGYAKIYEEASTKYGTKYADSLIDKVRNDIEVNGKLSEELTKEISDKFTKIYTKRSGGLNYVNDEEVAYNNVKIAINGVLDAQNELDSKKKQVENVYSWLKISEKDIKENKGYWETQKKAFQDRLNSLTIEQAKSEEGLKLKKQIVEIDEAISAYETKEKKENKGSKESKANDPLRERLSLLKDANDMYKTWAALIGGEKALGVVQTVMPDFNPDTFRSEIESVLKKGSKDTKVEAAKMLTSLDKDTIENALSTVQKDITTTIAKWDLFSKLFETSGDYRFSINASLGDTDLKSVLDQLKGDIENELKKGDKGLSFEDVIKLDSGDVGKVFGAEMEAYVKAYQDQSKKLSDESLMRAAELLKTYKNYEQQRKDIIKQGEQDIADLIANGAPQEAIDEANKRMSESLASLDFKEFKDSDMWASVFEDMDRLSTDTINSAITKLEEFSNTAGKDLPINEFKELMNVLKKLRGEFESRNPLKSLVEGIKSFFKAGDDATKKENAIDKIRDSFKNAEPYLQSFTSAFGSLSSMFDSLGNEGMSNVMNYAQEAVSSISGIGEGFAKGGIVGGISSAVGEAVKWIGTLAGAHDQKLDKSIQKSQREVEKLQGLYEGIERSINRSLGNVSGLNRQQRQLMEQQIKELEKQKKAEEGKKKSDKSKVDDYGEQIAELKDQTKYFAEDLANELYGIDFKGWASQLGDALFEAWKKGEDGAEAFKKKSAEILGDVLNNVLKVAILEPMMEDLRKALYGEDGGSGYLGKDNELDEKELAQLSDILMKGSKQTDAYFGALDELNNYMEKNGGKGFKDASSKAEGLSTGIKGITENTADILASLANAMRADGAKSTEAITRYVNDIVPEMSAMAKMQLVHLLAISNNTKKNADMAEEIRDLFSAVISGTKQINVK